MSRIQTNTASLRGIRSLAANNKTLNNSLTRLTTGLKINAGQDNPAGLIASETLRSQVAAIEQSISNNTRAGNVIATADAALGEVNSLLIQVRSLVQEGLNDGAISQSEIEANQLQIDSALSAINRISSNTTFGGDKLLDGSKSFQTTVSDGLTDYVVNEATFGKQAEINLSAEVIQAAETAELVATGGPLDATALEVGGSRGTEVIFLGKSADAEDMVTAINAISDATGVEAEVTVAGRKGVGQIDFGAGAGTDTIELEALKANGYEIQFNETTGATVDQTAVTGVTVNDTTQTVVIDIDINDNATSTDTMRSVLRAINTDDEASKWVKATASPGADVDQLITGNIDIAGSDLDLDSTVVGAAPVAGTSDLLESRVTFKSSEYGSEEFVEVNVLSGALATEDLAGNTATRDEGEDIIATINGQQARGRGLRASIKTSNLDAALVFSDAASENVSGNVETIKIAGGGATFQIGEQVSSSGQIGVGIEAVNTARLGGASGKLYELSSTGGKSLLDVSTNNPGSVLVDIVEEAINEVSVLRGRLGALQKNVIETTTTSLGVALENISESRSRIIDTDFAEETAQLTRAQILTQAGYSSLQIANQNPQQVLSLLG